MTVIKQTLFEPFLPNISNHATLIMESIHIFANAGGAGTQPAIIPDLLGNHDIAMTYADPLDGISIAGDLLLSAKSLNAGSTNTYGQFSGTDSTWNTAQAGYSSIILIQTVVPVNSHASNPDYLIEVMGFIIKMSPSKALHVSWSNNASHGCSVSNLDAGLSVGDEVTIVMQVDRIGAIASLVVNGTDYSSSLVVNGNPWGVSGIVSNYSWLGRHNSWSNYYGWHSPIKLLGLSGKIPAGSELDINQLIELCNNPYDILEAPEDVDVYGLQLTNSTNWVDIPVVELDAGDSVEIDFISPSVAGAWKCITDGDISDNRGYVYVVADGTIGYNVANLSGVLLDGAPISNLVTPFPFDGQRHVITLTSSANDTRIARFGAEYTGVNSIAYQLVQITINAARETHYFDCNQTSGNTITSKTSGLVATLVNMTDANWQPIIPKQEYTIGSGKDYLTAASMESATQNLYAHKIGLISGDTGETGSISMVDHSGVIELRAAIGEEADFKGGGAKLGTAVVYGARCKSIVRSLRLHAYVGSNGDATNDNYVDSCHIDNGGTLNGVAFADLPLIVTNTLITNCNRGAYSGANTVKKNVHFFDCVFVDNRDYNALRANFVNCIATGATSGDYLGAVLTNCVSEDGTASSEGSQANLDITEAYVNKADGDFRINQAWADSNLVSKGWNGSDIVFDFYYDNDIPTTEHTVTFESTVLGLVVDDFSSQLLHDVSLEKNSCSLLVNDITVSQAIPASFDKTNVAVKLADIGATQTVSASFSKSTSAVSIDDIVAKQSITASFDPTIVTIKINDFSINGANSHTVSFEKNIAQVIIDDVVASQSISADFIKNTVGISVDGLTATQTITSDFECNQLAISSSYINANQSITVTPDKVMLRVIIDDFTVISEVFPNITLKNVALSLDVIRYGVTLEQECYGVTLEKETYQFTLEKENYGVKNE